MQQFEDLMNFKNISTGKRNVSHLKHKKQKVRVSTVLSQKVCRHKNKEKDDGGIWYCRTCYVCLGPSFMHSKQQPQAEIVIWSRIYDRSRWKELGMEYIFGEHNELLGHRTLLEIAREIPNPFTWYQVYKVYTKYKLNEHWTGFGEYVDLKIKLNNTIMLYVDKYLNICNTKYRVSYLYLLYKFVQLFGTDKDDCKYVPFHRSKAWIKKNDEWWKTVCEEEKFEFKSTVIYKLEWNKEIKLAKIAKALKVYNEINNDPSKIEKYKDYLSYSKE